MKKASIAIILAKVAFTTKNYGKYTMYQKFWYVQSCTCRPSLSIQYGPENEATDHSTHIFCIIHASHTINHTYTLHLITINIYFINFYVICIHFKLKLCNY